MTLVSASEMAALRDIAESGMSTVVAIYHGTNTETVNGQAWVYPATPDLTVFGWLTDYTSTGAGIDIDAGRIGNTETHRLMLPFGTDCRMGDRVVVAGEYYVVQHTNASNTYQPALYAFLKVEAR
jgi:hypothetical protein